MTTASVSIGIFWAALGVTALICCFIGCCFVAIWSNRGRKQMEYTAATEAMPSQRTNTDLATSITTTTAMLAAGGTSRSKQAKTHPLTDRILLSLQSRDEAARIKQDNAQDVAAADTFFHNTVTQHLATQK